MQVVEGRKQEYYIVNKGKGGLASFPLISNFLFFFVLFIMRIFYAFILIEFLFFLKV